MIRGLTYHYKHNYKDFGLVLEHKRILPPSKKKIKLDIPYMNGSYDFSTVATNGEPIYTERKIEVMFVLPSRSKEFLHVFYSQALEWLMDTGRQKLVFDDICDFYFEAEVESISNFEEMIRSGKLAVIFTAQPFKTGVNEEGSDIWDTFNFETDIVQNLTFEINLAEEFIVVNIGRTVMPTIESDGPMALDFKGKRYNLKKGDNKFYDLKLTTGENKFVAGGGWGIIKFKFRKQVI